MNSLAVFTIRAKRPTHAQLMPHLQRRENKVVEIIMAIQVNRENQEQVEDGETYGPQLVGKLEVKKLNSLCTQYQWVCLVRLREMV